MCGRYYIAPDEEEEDWEEIIAILQRRGETVKTVFPFVHLFPSPAFLSSSLFKTFFSIRPYFYWSFR